MIATILVVEDEENIASFIIPTLEREGFQVNHVLSGEEALLQVERNIPDVVLLDIMLPGIDGLEVCRRIRAREDYIPIIMLTAKEEEIDRVVGLELGADDYVTKPFSPRELAARVRAVLRIAQRSMSVEKSLERMVIDDRMQIDLAGREVFIEGERVELTPKEFSILELLASNRGRVFGRDSLLERVWGYDFYGVSRTVDVHIQRLRYKIEPDTENPIYILTVRTIGYKFAEEN